MNDDPEWVDPADGGKFLQKWQKLWCCPRCCLPCNVLLSPCRRAVSQKKVRYRRDGFDLDLAYITPRIIVHGFPATGVEHLFRNPRYELRRFFEEKHGGHYRVYNFCCEPGRNYPPELFDGRVERYPFRDHAVPPIELTRDFCTSAKRWLDADPKNVVCIHCKAGKGRSGIMAACLLLRAGDAPDARAAMELYDTRRATDARGLTVTSQRKCETTPRMTPPVVRARALSASGVTLAFALSLARRAHV